MAQLTAYGRFVSYVYRLESEYRRERDTTRRGKLLVRLALARVALAESGPSRAIVVWRRLAADHLPFWDRELDHPEWDPEHEVVGTDELLARQHDVPPFDVHASDELKRVSLDHHTLPADDESGRRPNLAEEYLTLP